MRREAPTERLHREVEKRLQDTSRRNQRECRSEGLGREIRSALDALAVAVCRVARSRRLFEHCCRSRVLLLHRLSCVRTPVLHHESPGDLLAAMVQSAARCLAFTVTAETPQNKQKQRCGAEGATRMEGANNNSAAKRCARRRGPHSCLHCGWHCGLQPAPLRCDHECDCLTACHLLDCECCGVQSAPAVGRAGRFDVSARRERERAPVQQPP